MSLRDKLDETKLKNLTYGDNSPYVTVDITTQKVRSAIGPLPVKNSGRLIDAAVIDTARITSFNLKNLNWGVKQISLQAMNSKSNFGYINGFPSRVPSTDQLYNPLNTLTQVPLTGFGLHTPRKGIAPGGLSTDIGTLLGTDLGGLLSPQTYEGVKKLEITSGPNSKNPLVIFSNRLLRLGEVGTSSLISKIIKPSSFVGKLINNVVNLFKNPNEPIYSYLGGPNSKGGLGVTTIRRYYNSIEAINNPYYLRGFEIKALDRTQKDIFYNQDSEFPNGTKLNYSLLLGASNVYSTNTPNIIDNQINDNPLIPPSYLNQTPTTPGPNPLFNIFVTGSAYQGQTTTGSYLKHNSNAASLITSPSEISYFNGTSTVTIKTPNKGWYGISREVRVTNGKRDGINLTPLFDIKGAINDTISTSQGLYNIRDLIKFRIEAIDTDNPTNSTLMVFRALLTDMSDSISGEWESNKFLGRAEKLYTYSGFDRNVNISFKVASLSKEEMQPMYNKLNFLQSNMMGDYNNNGILRGSFMKITVGNWFNRQPCKIDSLTYKIPNESPWEISIDEPEGGSKLLILPHVVEVSMTLTPIGAQTKGINQTPRKGTSQSNIAQNENDFQYITGSVEGQAVESTPGAILSPLNLP